VSTETRTQDAFERRRPQTQRYLGRLCNSPWDAAHAALAKDGWSVRVFRNGKEVTDWSVADPEKDEVTCGNGTLKGNVEIRMTRNAAKQEQST
jgi:hypothetical protein